MNIKLKTQPVDKEGRPLNPIGPIYGTTLHRDGSVEHYEIDPRAVVQPERRPQ